MSLLDESSPTECSPSGQEQSEQTNQNIYSSGGLKQINRRQDRLTTGLKIQVDNSRNYNNDLAASEPSLGYLGGLGDPIVLQPSLDMSPSNVSFDKVTSLPTPIINTNKGSFGNFGSPTSGETIVMPKVRKNLTSADQMSGRVVSEYIPIQIGRKNSLLENTTTTNKRFISNPASESIDLAVSSPLTPPTDNLESKFSNSVFHSSRSGCDYKYENEIGNGAFSTVILASNVSNFADQIAIKIVSIPLKSKSEISNFKYFIKRELNILHQVNHPCIIKILDYNINLSINKSEIESSNCFESETEADNDLLTSDEYSNLKISNQQQFFLKYSKGGNLFEFSSQYYKSHVKELSYWKIMERIICELVQAVAYLHSNNIIHRDIKLENVLINYTYDELLLLTDIFSHEPVTCLTDFGLSKKLKTSDQLLSTRCGSQDYISPEILMGLKYDGSLTDSWSLGVLIYSILENRLPFDIAPISPANVAGVSPSVVKRRRARNNVAHRIAMIDWNWFTVQELLSDQSVDDSIKEILNNLKDLVGNLLVRKDKRFSISQLLVRENFSWISEKVPPQYLL